MQNEEISALLAHWAWKSAPAERDARYFRVWQQVSVALQTTLRTRIPELYFRDDVSKYEDREAAYQFVVYEAGRMFYGRPRTEFTFDVADPATLPAVLRTIGRSMRTVLERIEKRLYEAGRPELARRYSPVWHHDILAVVQNKPKPLVGLLAMEAKLVDGVIDLGTARNAVAVNRFSKASNACLRSVCGRDMRELGAVVMDEAERMLGGSGLSQNAGQDLRYGGREGGGWGWGDLEDGHVRATRGPDFGIGGEEDRDYRGSDGGGEVGDAGVVAEVHTGGGEPARKPVQIVDAHSVFKGLLGTGAPFDGHVELRGDGAKRLKRPVLPWAC